MITNVLPPFLWFTVYNALAKQAASQPTTINLQRDRPAVILHTFEAVWRDAVSTRPSSWRTAHVFANSVLVCWQSPTRHGGAVPEERDQMNGSVIMVFPTLYPQDTSALYCYQHLSTSPFLQPYRRSPSPSPTNDYAIINWFRRIPCTSW